MFNKLTEIKRLRKKYDLTQVELAKISGVSQSLITKIESGLIEPTYKNAVKIFEVLNSYSKESDLVAKDFIKSGMICVSPEDDIKKVTQKMKKYEISQLPVIDKNKVMGLISEKIIIENLFKGKQDIKVKNIMEEAPPIISMNTNIKIIANLLKEFPLLIVQDSGNNKGIITKSDLIQKEFK